VHRSAVLCARLHLISTSFHPVAAFDLESREGMCFSEISLVNQLEEEEVMRKLSKWMIAAVALAVPLSASANDGVKKLTENPNYWAYPGGNYNNWRYSALDQINNKNANKLVKFVIFLVVTLQLVLLHGMQWKNCKLLLLIKSKKSLKTLYKHIVMLIRMQMNVVFMKIRYSGVHIQMATPVLD